MLTFSEKKQTIEMILYACHNDIASTL